MFKRFLSISIIAWAIHSPSLFSQIGLTSSALKTPPLLLKKESCRHGSPVGQYAAVKTPFQVSKSAFIVRHPSFKKQKPETHLPFFSAHTLPFFCKIEHQLNLNKKLPVKFRLGDVQYVEELEGK
jgi:hypothetical protein